MAETEAEIGTDSAGYRSLGARKFVENARRATTHQDTGSLLRGFEIQVCFAWRSKYRFVLRGVRNTGSLYVFSKHKLSVHRPEIHPEPDTQRHMSNQCSFSIRSHSSFAWLAGLSVWMLLWARR